MPRGTKKKLALFAGTSKCLIYAEAKYCPAELSGEVKYYECSRTDYCCALGCCVSPTSHFQHHWYYWLLLVIMFLICVGGSWWYRYWLQGRYRAVTSVIPNRPTNPRPQHSLRGPTCHPQQARISYNSARDTVFLHRMWKVPQRNGGATSTTSLPTYGGLSNATTSTTHYQNISVLLNEATCPYYQLYGPPPSYETVIAQSRNKMDHTGRLRLNSQSTMVTTSTTTSTTTTPNIITNPTVAQCFVYPCNPSSRLNMVDRYAATTSSNIPTTTTTSTTTTTTTTNPISGSESLSSRLQQQCQNCQDEILYTASIEYPQHRVTVLTQDNPTGCGVSCDYALQSNNDRPCPSYELNRDVDRHLINYNYDSVDGRRRRDRSFLLKNHNKSPVLRVHNNFLRINGQGSLNRNPVKFNERLKDFSSTRNRNVLEDVNDDRAQSNPSTNVILNCLTRDEDDDEDEDDIIGQRRRLLNVSSRDGAGTSNNYKCKLDRSKSLD